MVNSSDNTRMVKTRSVIKKFLVLTIGIPAVCFGIMEVGARVAGDKMLGLERQGLLEEIIYRDRALIILDELDASGLLIEDMNELDMYTQDRFLIFKLKPNIHLTTPNFFAPRHLMEQTRWTLSTNSRGLRDQEHPYEHPDTIYRILALGDSSTFGWGVDDGQSYPDRLERILNARDESSRFEVVNLGIPGYTSAQGVRVLRRQALPYQPQMLIINFGNNDSSLTSPQTADQAVLERGASWVGVIQEALGHSKLYVLLRGVALRRNQRAARTPDPSTQTSRVPQSEYAQNLREMVHLARGHGARVFFVDACVPAAYRSVMEQVAREFEVPLVNTDALYARALETIQQGNGYHEEARYYEQLLGKEVLDDRPSLYTKADFCHPNAFGHQLIAETIAAQVHLEALSRRTPPSRDGPPHAS